MKAILVTRLKESVANAIVSVEISDSNILSNIDGDNFEPMAHWKLLAPGKEGVSQDELNNVDGYHLRAAIESGSANGENKKASATK